MPQNYQQYQDSIIDPKTQQMLNQPPPVEIADEQKNFLKMLVGKLEKGELNPHLPASLYNHAVYDKLSDEDKEKADLTAINLMSVIRQIERLWQMDHKETFQIQNLVETVLQMKTRFEDKYGDVYII